MRAYEFLNEAETHGKVRKNVERASKGLIKARDTSGIDKLYHLNRIAMAMAMADGKSQDAVTMDAASFAEKYNTIHPYTEEEYNMFISASKTISSDVENLIPYSKSTESDDTNVTSTLVPFKGYKKK